MNENDDECKLGRDAWEYRLPVDGPLLLYDKSSRGLVRT